MTETRPQAVRVTITTATLLKVIAVLLALYIAFLIRDILAILFIALVLASALRPWVDWLQKKGIHRLLAVAIIYLAGFAVVGGAIWLSVPAIVEQSSQLSSDMPMYIDRFNQYFANVQEFTQGHDWLRGVTDYLAGATGGQGGGIFASIIGFFGGLFSFFIILVITFYMIAEQNSIKKLIWSLTPERHQAYALDVFRRMQNKMGLWFQGQLVLCVAIFLLTYLGLSILGVKYALILALIAGLTELIPYLGPIIGGIPAVFVALTQAPLLALFVIILYVIIQQIENTLLVPKIMQKAVGLNPLVSIVVIMVGFSIGGVLGALIAIPAATAGTVIVGDIFKKKHALSMQAMEEEEKTG